MGYRGTELYQNYMIYLFISELKQESDGKLSKMFPTLEGSIVEHSQDIFNKLYDETNTTDSKNKQTKSANKTEI